jgi:hypothetical protein
VRPSARQPERPKCREQIIERLRAYKKEKLIGRAHCRDAIAYVLNPPHEEEFWEKRRITVDDHANIALAKTNHVLSDESHLNDWFAISGVRPGSAKVIHRKGYGDIADIRVGPDNSPDSFSDNAMAIAEFIAHAPTFQKLLQDLLVGLDRLEIHKDDPETVASTIEGMRKDA